MDTPTTQSPLLLPTPLQRRLEAAASSFLNAGERTPQDFSVPRGEAALCTPDSVTWKVFKNPVTLFIGGVAAVVLELAEPRVRSGVWEHTSFRRDPQQRLRRTALAAMMTVYGPRSQAEAMIGRVSAMHSRISGVTPCGQAYRADDPELLDWVQATASFGFLEAYCAYVRPLAERERDLYYQDGIAAAGLYGASATASSVTAVRHLFDAMHDKLEASPVVHEFLALMRGTALLPRALAPVQRLLVQAALDIVPAAVLRRLGIEARLHPLQRRVLKAAARAADRVVLRDSPAVQSCRRLGLPDDYLYRG